MIMNNFMKFLCMMFILTNFVLSKKNEMIILFFFKMKSMNCMITILSLMMIMISLKKNFNYSKKNNMSMVMVVTVTFLCILSFNSNNLFTFFILFETSIIPMTMMIFYLSKSKDKISASLYMLIMSMIGSLPFLMYLASLYMNEKTLEMEMLSFSMTKILEYMDLLLVLILLMTKIPIFFIHMWLPKAHVEASTLGSMILASLMLKLGILGLLKNSFMMEEILSNSKGMIMSISWICSIICMIWSIMLADIKKMAAISSISHMGLTTNSLLSFKTNGFMGAMLMTISHGLVSSVMFLLVGLMYENSESRSIFSNKSMESMNKQMSMWWILTIFSNVGIPPMSSFFSEIFMTMTFLSIQKSSMIFMGSTMILISTVSMLYITKSNFMKMETSSFSLKMIKNSIMNFIFSTIFLNLFLMKTI